MLTSNSNSASRQSISLRLYSPSNSRPWRDDSSFGTRQNTTAEILSEVLKKALDHGGYLPERDPKQLATVLESEAESTYGIDGTERPRQRPCDAEEQQHYYSGKKKGSSALNRGEAHL